MQRMRLDWVAVELISRISISGTAILTLISTIPTCPSDPERHLDNTRSNLPSWLCCRRTRFYRSIFHADLERPCSRLRRSRPKQKFFVGVKWGNVRECHLLVTDMRLIRTRIYQLGGSTKEKSSDETGVCVVNRVLGNSFYFSQSTCDIPEHHLLEC